MGPEPDNDNCLCAGLKMLPLELEKSTEPEVLEVLHQTH